jgi:hypothetical protein
MYIYTVCAPGGFGSGQTLRRCETAFASSRCLGAATLRDGLWTVSCLRVVATLRRCDAAGGSSRLRVFATLRRCATSLECLRVFAMLRRCDAAGGLVASSRLRDAATLRLASSSRLRVIRSGCGRPLASLQWREGA